MGYIKPCLIKTLLLCTSHPWRIESLLRSVFCGVVSSAVSSSYGVLNGVLHWLPLCHLGRRLQLWQWPKSVLHGLPQPQQWLWRLSWRWRMRLGSVSCFSWNVWDPSRGIKIQHVPALLWKLLWIRTWKWNFFWLGMLCIRHCVTLIHKDICWCDIELGFIS